MSYMPQASGLIPIMPLIPHERLDEGSFSQAEAQFFLTLKAPITSAADDNFFFIFFFYFSEKTNLDISCELSAWQTNHMKCQDLF